MLRLKKNDEQKLAKGQFVSFEFEIVYLECNLADEHIESKPVLRTYMDAHFERTEENGGIVTTHLDENDFTKVYEGKLHGDVLHTSIPVTSCVGFVQYAMRRNEYGHASMTHAGTAKVKIHEIMASLEKGIPFETTRNLEMEPSRLFADEPISKGKIKFRVTKMEVSKDCKFVPLNQCLLCDANMEGVNNVISEFIDDRVRTESSMQDTWPGIKNVRAPMDISSASIQSTHNIFLPIESLVLPQPFQVNIEYFQNALETCMKRKGYTLGSDYRNLDIAHKAELMMEICCYAAQSFDYISDTVETSVRTKIKSINNRVSRINATAPSVQYDPTTRRPWEDMGNSAEINGDCEDGSNCIDTFFQNFRKMGIDPSRNKELYELQQISLDYVYFNTLATVHGAKAEDNTEHIGAHMYGLAIPNSQVKKMLETNTKGAVTAEKMDLTQKNEHLPTLVAEGTGMVRPLGSSKADCLPKNARQVLAEHIENGLITGNSDAPSTHISYDPLFNERKYISRNMYTKGGMKTLIPRDMGAESTFYLGQLLGVTSQQIERTKVGAFIFGNITSPSGGVTRGAYFTDILNQRNNVALIPCSPVPDKIMQIAYEANTLRAPLRPFVLDRKKPIEGGPVNPPEFEKMKKQINGLGRKGTAPFGSVDIHIKTHQYTAKSLALMTENLVQMKAVFKVDYEREIYTNSEIGYRLKIYVDQKSCTM